MSGRIFVTGSRGYIGVPLCVALKEAGYRVTDLPPHCDIRDREAIKEHLPRDTEYILHIAGRIHGNSEEIWSVNALGALSLLEVATMHCSNLIGFFAFGSAAEYGVSSTPCREDQVCQPINCYGQSKLVATSLVLNQARTCGLSALIIRPFNIMGIDCSKKTLPMMLVEALVRNNYDNPIPISLLGPDYVRDWIAIEDVISCTVELLSFRGEPTIVNIANGRGYTNRSVAEEFAHQRNKKIVITEQEIQHNKRKELIPCSVAAIDMLRSLLPKWKPKYPTLCDMVRQTLASFDMNH